MFGGFYLYRKYYYEKGRLLQWERMEKLKDLPAHHFSNRGGVLFLKEFVGFEKYFSNDKAVSDWYAKVYPEYFSGKDLKAEAPPHHG